MNLSVRDIILTILGPVIGALVAYWLSTPTDPHAISARISWVKFHGGAGQSYDEVLAITRALEKIPKTDGLRNILAGIMDPYGAIIYTVAIENHGKKRVENIEISPKYKYVAIVRKGGISERDSFIFNGDYGHKFNIGNLDPGELLFLSVIVSGNIFYNVKDSINIIANGFSVDAHSYTIGGYDGVGLVEYLVSKAPLSEFVVLILSFSGIIFLISLVFSSICYFNLKFRIAVMGKSDISKTFQFANYVSENRPDLVPPGYSVTYISPVQTAPNAANSDQPPSEG